jgi:large subunit ribosomal protein L21e
MFSRAHKKRGVEHLSTYLKNYKFGDIVDVKGCGTFQKGMPQKAYHGKTGHMFNISKHAVGAVINKRVKGNILPKRISVRIEHVKHSQCDKDFLDRVHANEVKKKEAKAEVICKGLLLPPREAHIVSSKDNDRPSAPSPLSSWHDQSSPASCTVSAQSIAHGHIRDHICKKKQNFCKSILTKDKRGQFSSRFLNKKTHF